MNVDLNLDIAVSYRYELRIILGLTLTVSFVYPMIDSAKLLVRPVSYVSRFNFEVISCINE